MAVAVLASAMLYANTSHQVNADEKNIVDFSVGVKAKGDKNALGVSYVNNDKHQVKELDSLAIKGKREEVKTEGLSLEQLQSLKTQLDNKISETQSKINTHNAMISNRTIQKNATQTQIDEAEDSIKEIQDKAKDENDLTTSKSTTPSSLSNSTASIAVNYPTTSLNTSNINKEDKQIADTKESIQEKETKVMSLSNEENSLTVAKKEAEQELDNLNSDKAKLEEAIKQKEEEKRIQEEQEAQRKALEEANKRAEQEAEAKRIACQNQDFNANARGVAYYSGNSYVTNTDQVKDSDFDIPSVQATQTGYAGNNYALGQCTWYVYNRIAQTGHHIDSYLGNAADWGNSAKALGYQVTDKPVAGAAVVFQPGVEGASSYGHVGFVEHVYSDGSFLTSEMNVGGVFIMAWRHLTPSQGISFVIPE